MSSKKRTPPDQKDYARLAAAAAFAQGSLAKGGSPHPSVQVGALLVDAAGHEIAKASNRFAHGVNAKDVERYADGRRSMWINCAEQMAIMQAAREGIPLQGARIYVTLEPCAVCAGLIAEAGISDVFVPAQSVARYGRLKIKWQRSIEIGRIKLAEAGVRVHELDDQQTLDD